jgi:hypothetical protein
MAFRSKPPRNEATPPARDDDATFRHSSRHTDLDSLLAEHTLRPHSAAVTTESFRGRARRESPGTTSR